jgi:hypothetical protein
MKILNIILILLATTLSSCTTNTKTTNSIGIMIPIYHNIDYAPAKVSDLIKLGAHNKLEMSLYDTTNLLQIRNITALIKKLETKLILGPTNVSDTKFLAKLFKNDNINILSFAYSETTEKDSNIFYFGYDNISQAQKMLTFLESQNHQKYCILGAKGPNAQRVLDFATKTLTSAKILLSNIYSSESVEYTVRTLVEIIQSNTNQEQNTKIVLYTYGYENKTTEKLFQLIKKYDLDKQVILVGDQYIDSESNDSLDYIFTGSIKSTKKQFLKELEQLFGSTNLSPIELLAFDLGQISLYLHNKKDFSKKTISSIKDFYGVSGRISFDNNIVSRDYDIISYQNNSYKILGN